VYWRERKQLKSRIFVGDFQEEKSHGYFFATPQ
jgi:hypothetical protein